MPKVVIYTQFLCPYCSRAQSLLRGKGVNYEEIDVGSGGPVRAAMRERTGGKNSVPQIFIGDRHIGGSDDLMALDRAGELDALLAQ